MPPSSCSPSRATTTRRRSRWRSSAFGAFSRGTSSGTSRPRSPSSSTATSGSCAGSRPSCAPDRPRCSDFDAVCSTFVSLSLGFDELRVPRAALPARSWTRRRYCWGREHLHSQEHASTIARALAHRHGREAPSDDDTTLGAVGVLLYNRVFSGWLAGGGHVDLKERLELEFERTRRLVGRSECDSSV